MNVNNYLNHYYHINASIIESVSLRMNELLKRKNQIIKLKQLYFEPCR